MVTAPAVRGMDWRIRPAARTDAAAVRSIYGPVVETTAISFEVEPPSTAEIEARIESTLREHPWLVCEADGEVVGYASAGPLRSRAAYRWTVELSVYVDEAHRGRGVGTALYTSLLAALEAQGYYGAYAVTTLPNPASETFHERLGFDPVATFPAVGYKHGRWHDVRWWHKRIAPRPADPAPPTPLPDVRGTPAFERALAAGERLLG